MSYSSASSDVGESTRPSVQELDELAKELRRVYSQPSDRWPAPHLDEGVPFVEIGLLPEVKHPKDNPYSKEKAELGKKLFFDPRLSGSKQLACASCHNPELGWTDGITASFGHDRQENPRNSMPIMNSGFRTHLFWDGRAKTLEEQVTGPLFATNEMHADPEDLVRTVSSVPAYREAFKTIFGTDQITLDQIAKAIACFERTVVGGRSKFDAFMRGKTDALSDAAVRGLHLFRTKARCINCHNGPNFTDEGFHNNGLHGYGRKHQDLGRFNVTNDPADVGKFSTPSLRNVERTGPYMHHGLFEIDAVLTMYNAGGFHPKPTPAQKDDPLFPKTSPLLKPLNLTKQELSDLQAFLFSLTEPKQRMRVELDR
ncbi:MAG: methylamine utilization protein [Phycisphaerae bacterium]|jgi:cytochrome c peroxidase|nr:MAG: methylamine utilization protein [Phycisphaerae bacterium]